MIVMPAIDLMNGRVVQLEGGDPDAKRYDDADALGTLHRWKDEGATWVHVVDLDAAIHGNTNRDQVRSLLAQGAANFQVGGGIRSTAAVDDLFTLGATRVVIGTKGLEDPDWLQTVASKYPDRIVLAVDAREGRIVDQGWTRTGSRDFVAVAQTCDAMKLAGFLYTAVHVEGKLKGPDVDGIRRLKDAVKTPVIASGGIGTLDHVRAVRDAGSDAAVIGLALYARRFSLAQAIQVAQEQAA